MGDALTEKRYMNRRGNGKPSKSFHIRRHTERAMPRTCTNSNNLYGGALSIHSRSKKNSFIGQIVEPGTFLYMGQAGESAL